MSKLIENTDLGYQELKKKVDFLGKFCAEFRKETPPDIYIKPGDDGPCLPAHKTMLVIEVLTARSEVLKKVLDLDEFKPAASGTIAMSELTSEELQCLLEFLYTGSLPVDSLEKYAYPLLTAADKYEVPYLMDICEGYIARSLNLQNVLHALEFAEIHKRSVLKNECEMYIVVNMDVLIYSAKYQEWASKNPDLALDVTRALYALLNPEGAKRAKLNQGSYDEAEREITSGSCKANDV